MIVSSRNELFTASVQAVAGAAETPDGLWAVAVAPCGDGSYLVELCRVVRWLPLEVNSTRPDTRQVTIFAVARIVELTELQAIVELWRHGKLVSTQALPDFPLVGVIPAFLSWHVSGARYQWVHITDGGKIMPVPEIFEFSDTLT